MSGSHHIAIVGFAGRFPGAQDPRQLWLNLRDGVNSIVFPSDAELLAAGVPPRLLTHPTYVKAVACAPDVEDFDAQFFGYTPKDALTCDPQIRMFLEAAHAALENAGYNPYACPGSVGVYGSTGTNRYMDLHLGYADDVSATAGFAFSTLNYTDYLASTVSYKLGLRGPAITLATACSSSLVAVHLACQALRNGECDSAVAGGSEVEMPLGHGYLWEEGGPMSRDGQVRPFDVNANGTVFGTGVGVVVLKRLADAIADRDTVLAVIRGSAINNDGSDKAGFSAPSVTGQALMLGEAMTMADVSPADISYIECHATATHLGDPVEIAALDRAYRRLHPGGGPGPCAIGSIKGNIGHLGHAAGVVSLIKVILSLRHGQIPATLNFTEPNPKLQLERTPFYVAGELQPWPQLAGRPRCAGVSAFGIGGTNAHVIVEDGPRQPLPRAASRPRVVVWSAVTDQAEQAYREQLRLCLGSQGDEMFAAAVGTLQDGRRGYAIRRAVVATSAQEALAAVSGDRNVIKGRAECREIAFLFPGQGSQRAAMGAGLYQADPVFREVMDEVLGLFDAHGTALRADWLNGPGTWFDDTRLTQPLLFAVEYALARMLSAWGIQAAAVVGHSLGELTAATVAGVFTLPDAVAFVQARADAMARAPTGGMLAVALPPEELGSLLPAELSVAVVNGRKQTVVAGPVSHVEAFHRVLTGRRVGCIRLATSWAFHSPLMSAAAAELQTAVARVRCGPPELPLHSAACGRAITADEASSPQFWAAQVSAPVRFDRALGALLADSKRIVLEVGPGNALTAVARSHPASGESLFVPVLPRATGDREEEHRQALRAAARVWADGHDLDWQAARGGEATRRVPLPGYQYQRRRCWAELRSAAGAERTSAPAFAGPAAASQFSIVCWREEPRPPRRQPPAEADCLLFVPADPGNSLRVIASLQRAGLRPVIVRPGARYSEAAGSFTARPGSSADLRGVLTTLAGRGARPSLLVHALTAIPAEGAAGAAVTSAGARLDQSLHSFLALVEAAAQHGAGSLRPAVLVITTGSVDVTGAEAVDPATAALPAAARSVIKNVPQAACRVIDIAAADEMELAAEAALWQQHGVVAIRGSRRWVSYRIPFDADETAALPPSVVRPQGGYLLVGGLGGLGLAVARGLAGSGMRPQLALLTGEDLSPQATDDRSARLRDQLAEIETLGARVGVIACDLTDRRALGRALDTATTTLGQIHGVVHLAGDAGVQGTLMLSEALAERPALDFFVRFSSRAATDGMGGDPCRAAAHAVQDACVLALRHSGIPALTINVPYRADQGSDGEPGIAPERVSGLLFTLLRSRHPGQVLVEREHSPARRDRQPRETGGVADPAGLNHDGSGQPAADGNLAEKMTAIWAEVIGDPQVDPDADFTDLGGNSLTAASLVSSIGREFGIDVSIAELLHHPTIRGLTEILRAKGVV